MGNLFIILCVKDVYVTLAFSQIGFVLHNLVQMIAVFLPLTTDSTDFADLVNVFMLSLSLPMLSSSHLLKTPVAS